MKVYITALLFSPCPKAMRDSKAGQFPKPSSATATQILVVMFHLKIPHEPQRPALRTDEAEDNNTLSIRTQLTIHIKKHEDYIWPQLGLT